MCGDASYVIPPKFSKQYAAGIFEVNTLSMFGFELDFRKISQKKNKQKQKPKKTTTFFAWAQGTHAWSSANFADSKRLTENEYKHCYAWVVLRKLRIISRLWLLVF